MLLDTSAWVEYLIGSEKGNKVKGELAKGISHTSIVSLSELTNWSLRESQETNKIIDAVTGLSNVIGLDDETAVLSGKLNYERKKKNREWGMLDSIIMATAMIYELDILTCDNDFKDVQTATVL